LSKTAAMMITTTTARIIHSIFLLPPDFAGAAAGWAPGGVGAAAGAVAVGSAGAGAGLGAAGAGVSVGGVVWVGVVGSIFYLFI
jgi:hypothetical protein